MHPGHDPLVVRHLHPFLHLRQHLDACRLLHVHVYTCLSDRRRTFTQRVPDTMPRKAPPNIIQARGYDGTLPDLGASTACGAGKSKADGAATVAQMKAMP